MVKKVGFIGAVRSCNNIHSAAFIFYSNNTAVILSRYYDDWHLPSPHSASTVDCSELATVQLQVQKATIQLPVQW